VTGGGAKSSLLEDRLSGGNFWTQISRGRRREGADVPNTRVNQAVQVVSMTKNGSRKLGASVLPPGELL